MKQRGNGIAPMAALLGDALNKTRAASLALIAADLLGALRDQNGPSWVQRRWGTDIDLVLQHKRAEGVWRLAARVTDGTAPDDDTLRTLAAAFGAPAESEWKISRKELNGRLGVRQVEIAELYWRGD